MSQRYYRVIELKTAVLFAAACKTAGLLAGLPETRSEELAVYGRKTRHGLPNHG